MSLKTRRFIESDAEMVSKIAIRFFQKYIENLTTKKVSTKQRIPFLRTRQIF